LFSTAGNLVSEKIKLFATRGCGQNAFLFENLNEEPLLLNEEGQGSEKVIGESED